MKLLARLAVLTLIGTLSIPSAAKSMRTCTGLPAHDRAVVIAHRDAPCVYGADAPSIQRGRHVTAPCSAAASTYDNTSLVELHRSIRDGGLGVLRPPANGYGANPIAANRSEPASCGAG